MTLLAGGLSAANHHEDALFVGEAELSTRRRFGSSEQNILVVQGNLANTYAMLRRFEEGLRLRRDVYSGTLKLLGEEHFETLREAFNYTMSLISLKHFKEAKSLMLKVMPVARRVFGERHLLVLRMRINYAKALFFDPSATHDDLREAVTMLEETGRTTRRVLGGAHTLTMANEHSLRESRAALRARETAPSDIS